MGPAHAPRPIAMVVHAYYDEDPRVRREAEALVATGRDVDVFALRRPGDAPLGDLLGVRVHRLDVQRHQGAPIGVYLAEYLEFFARAAASLVSEHRTRRYGLVQVHTIPDFLIFAATPLKLAGVPLVLDFHEAMPAFFESRFPRLANPFTGWLLGLQEVASAGLADAVIAVNEAVADRLAAAGVRPAKITVVHNSPSPGLFDLEAHPRRPFMEDDILRLVYAGALTPNYELDVVLDALSQLRRRRPDQEVRLDVYGRGDSEMELRAQADSIGLADVVTFHGRIPLETMAAAIADGDVGLAPIRSNAQTELSLPTKILEYAVMGKPVVASDLATVVQYFHSGELVTYRAGDAAALADAIGLVVDHPPEAAVRAARAAARSDELAWAHESARYVAVVDRIAVP